MLDDNTRLIRPNEDIPDIN